MNGGRNAKTLLRFENHALELSIEQCIQLNAPADNVVENLRKVIDLGWILLEIRDRKSTRLNSSHRTISYAVFCLKKKKNKTKTILITSQRSRSTHKTCRLQS